MPNGNIDRFLDLMRDLREITPAGDGEIVAMKTEGSVYQFELASSISEDGYQIVRPNEIGILSPGRWVKKDLAYGSHYQREESPGVSSTSSATFQDKLQLFAQGRKGDYILKWSARIQSTNAAGQIQTQIVRSPAIVADIFTTEPGGANWDQVIGGNIRLTLDGVNTLFQMQYRQSGGPGSVGIYKAVMELVRIGA